MDKRMETTIGFRVCKEWKRKWKPLPGHGLGFGRNGKENGNYYRV